MDNLKNIQDLRKDAKGTIWAFVIINVVAVLFWLIGSPLDKVSFVFVLVQVAFLVVWLLPYFLYQIIILKRDFKYAAYKTLSSYKELWVNFTY